MYKEGSYTPLSVESAVDIISEAIKYVPRYCRIMRIQRDIPAKFAEIAIAQNNLRQIVDTEVLRKGYKMQDIRSREIGSEPIVLPVKFEIINYESSQGNEYFISLVDAKDRLIGFTRLRFPGTQQRQEITKSTAIVRELHVYGKSMPIKQGTKNATDAVDVNIQHKGYGKMLLAKAEELAILQNKDKFVKVKERMNWKGFIAR
jgi:elongator complex protein 3